MKKIFILLLTFILSLISCVSFIGCSKAEEPAKWAEDNSLKILAIGNSFSEDAYTYLWDIAESLGIENVYLGHLFAGGTNLNYHYQHTANSTPGFEYRVINNGYFSRQFDYVPLDAITETNWDFISIQQVSGLSGIPSELAILGNYVDIISENCPESEIVWHMTWAYAKNSTHQDFYRYSNDQMTMYNAIVNTVTNYVTLHEKITKIIPSGTAIQNARTSYLGDSYFTRDGYHLSSMGQYVVGLTWISYLTGIEIPDTVYCPSTIRENKAIYIESAKNAIKNRFSITNSAYTN